MAKPVGKAIQSASERLQSAGVDSALLDAQLLMANILECSRLDIIVHPERELTGDEEDGFDKLVTRRAARYPLAYLLGYREFYGIDIKVTPGVLIPRPETELLVEIIVDRLRNVPNPTIADIGIGSGAISIAVAHSLPQSRIVATDLSDEAIQVAKANIDNYQLSDRINIIHGDLVSPLLGLGEKYDAIVSNPPYIASEEIANLEPEVRCYEPMVALVGGETGLAAYRRIYPDALGLLKPDGFVAVEIGQGQADAVSQIAMDSGYTSIDVYKDLAGIERVVVTSL